MRLVTLSPSVPASGESLTRNDMVTVGGSIGCAWIGDLVLGARRRCRPPSPSRARRWTTMSPASPISIGWRSRPRKARIFETRPVSTSLPSRSITLMVWFGFTSPTRCGPVTMRPRKGLASSSVPSIRNGPSSVLAGGTCLSTRSNSGARPWSLGPSGDSGHPAVAARTVEDREVELLVGGVERREEIEHLVDDFDVPRVGPVDLVDGDDGPQADLERLRDHELGLRHRPFGSVDQHDRAVDHAQDALDLAAEIGVAGGVDDVDAGILPDDRGRLGQDGDAALLLEVVRIHRALFHALVVAEASPIATGACRPAWSCRGRRGR